MRRLFIPLSLLIVFSSGVFAKEVAEKQDLLKQDLLKHDLLKQKEHSPAVKPQEESHEEKLFAEVRQSVKGHAGIQNSDKHSHVQPGDEHEPDVKHTEEKQNQVHHVEEHQSDEHKPEEHQSDSHSFKQQVSPGQKVSSGRQFHAPLYHHPMLFQPPTGFEAIRRQFGGGFGSDLVMMGLISLPIIGLLTMGGASIGNLLGLGASSSSNKKSSSKRNRRSLKDKAADAVEYAKNLWNVMEQLERAFEKYDLYQAECRLRVVCEAHHKDRRMGSWGQSILDLMR